MNHLDDKIKLIDFAPDDSWQHVIIASENRCAECREKPCLSICPSRVFRWDYGPDSPVLVYYKQCIECGACRLVCANIDFSYPHGPFGVRFRQG
jgi:ferredoxin like protein